MAEQNKPLSFIDSLTEDQIPYANEIVDKAKKVGIDPRLALSMTWVESRFNPEAVSPKGAIGLMQVMPDTGKGLGFSEKDLRNPSKNIDAGLKYLRQNIDKLGDPVLAVAGYNAGPDHPYFSDPKKDLPEETMAYLRDIKDLGGFTTTPPDEPQEPEVAEEVTPASDEDLRKQKAAMLGGLMGFGAGTATSAKRALFGESTPTSGTTAQTSGGRYAAKTGYGAGEGTVKEVVERYKQFEPRPLGEQMLADSKKSSMGAGPRALKVVPGTIAPLSIHAQVPALPETPKMTLGQRAGQTAQDFGRFMNRNPVVSSTLGGMGAGFQGQEASTRYQKGDMPGAAIAGMGALGGLASMVPSPPTRTLGAIASVASPAALAVLDRLREMRQQPNVPATQEEMRTAQKPAFMFPRP